MVKATVTRSQLRKVFKERVKLIQANIAVVLQNEATPHLIDLILVNYDKLSDRAAMTPEDPTNPANWREEFRAKLQQELSQTFAARGKRISVKLGEKKFLGYDAGENSDPDDTDPLKWLVFYIEGLAGEWAFISPETYEKFRGSGRYQSDWGRFGQGFMISKENYEAEGWGTVIPFEQVRHAFSGYSPLDIFAEALREFKVRPFLEKAIKAAMAGRKL